MLSGQLPQLEEMILYDSSWHSVSTGVQLKVICPGCTSTRRTLVGGGYAVRLYRDIST